MKSLGAVLILVVAASAAAAAPIAPDAAALFADVRAKSHADAWRDVILLRTVGTSRSSGLDGESVLVEDVRDGRIDERARYPVFALRDVWDGRVAWHQGNSGGVHRLDGADSTRHFIGNAWLAKRAWLKPDLDGAFAGPVRHEAGGDELTVVPRGGEPMTLSFDAATRDLVRIVRTRPTSLETTTLTDYREVDGLRLPFTIATTDSDGNASTTTVARYERLARATADLFVPPRTPDDTRIGTRPVTIPLDLADGVLTIEARLDGRGPYRFILDTGGHAIVSPAIAKELGLVASGAGQSGGAGEGTLTEQYTRIARVDLGGTDQRGFDAGGVTMTDQHFFVLDLGYPTFERGREAPIAGLLGVELFERLGVRIDYRARRLTLTSFARHRFARDAVVTPLMFDADIPLVTGILGGRAGLFALDTGNAGSTLVQHHWAERVGLAAAMKAGVETASFGAGGLSRNWASRLEPFEIGGARIEHQFGRYAEDRRGAFSSRTEAGNIGTDLLANFTIDFDYRRGLMGWQYVPGHVQEPFPRGGLRVLKDRPEDALVVSVSADSPAAAAGIEAKDRLVAIDGVPTSELSGGDIGNVFRRAPGTTVRLTVRRDERTVETSLVLRELLP